MSNNKEDYSMQQLFGVDIDIKNMTLEELQKYQKTTHYAIANLKRQILEVQKGDPTLPLLKELENSLRLAREFLSHLSFQIKMRKMAICKH